MGGGFSKKKSDPPANSQKERNSASATPSKKKKNDLSPPQDPHLLAMRASGGRRRRHSVFAESVTSDDTFELKVHPKSEAAYARITDAASKIFLFSGLDDDQRKQVFDAMFEKTTEPGETIIQQGGDGDFFYVIDQGDFEVFKRPDQSGDADSDKKVFEYNDGGSFGELALMYNCPRAATVRCSESAGGLLWALDRKTFQHLVIKSAQRKRETFEEFLRKPQLLCGLNARNRSQLADALVDQTLEAAETVITEGQRGDTFYFVVKGECVATQMLDDESVEVGRMHEGEYFGERALIKDEVRAATVSASNECGATLAKLDRASFERLLGPLRDRMAAGIQSYKSAVEIRSMKGESLAAP